jgi:hypothetical protein
MLGTTGIQEHFFRDEFPDLQQVAAPSYKILYPQQGWQMPFWLLREAPRLRQVIQAEQQWTERICQEFGIQLVISDNRFGCFAHNIPSVYITHQLRIAFPRMFRSFERIGERFHRRLQNPFAQVWVPDSEGDDNLGGRLSHTRALAHKVRYLGPLTRFATRNLSEQNLSQDIDLLALISGPEPQRSLFEEKIQALCKAYPGKVVLVQGKPGAEQCQANSRLEIHSHLPSEQLRQVILRSKLVLCRSGYSTLMDLQTLGAKAVLVPTPGQTEQEYLASSLRQKGFCGAMAQEQMSLERLREESRHAHGFRPPTPQNTALQNVVANTLARIFSSPTLY